MTVERNLENKTSWDYWVVNMVYIVAAAVLAWIISKNFLIVFAVDGKYKNVVYLFIYSSLYWLVFQKRLKHKILNN